MDIREIETLCSEEFRNEVERNLLRDPAEIALDRRVANARLVATQVKYLQRARRKLPTYYQARAVLPSLAFEQSSSELCASHKRYGGELAVDLTCGLGVDTLYLSRRFKRVVALEHNPTLAAITQHNLRLMGATNVEVLSVESEEFLATLDHADLIYADPDRRSAEGRKMVTLADCSPNLEALLPTLRTKANHLAFKLSPLFDLSEARRIFGSDADVEVISLGGEVKEVVVYISCTEHEPTRGLTCATALGLGTFSVGPDASATAPNSNPLQPLPEEGYGYLVVPDAALRKASLTAAWCGSEGLDCRGPYGFSHTLPTTRMGRIYTIEQLHPYSPKRLKPIVGRSIQLIRHSFPLSSGAICKALGSREGAGETWAFAKIDHQMWALRLSEPEGR